MAPIHHLQATAPPQLRYPQSPRFRLWPWGTLGSTARPNKPGNSFRICNDVSLQQGMSPDFGVSTLQTGIHGTRDSSRPRWRLSNPEEVSVEMHTTRHSPNPHSCSASDKSSVVKTAMLGRSTRRSARLDSPTDAAPMQMGTVAQRHQSWEHDQVSKCGPSAPRTKKKLQRRPASSTGPMARISPPIHVPQYSPPTRPRSNAVSASTSVDPRAAVQEGPRGE